jgi:hypothetical protein
MTIEDLLEAVRPADLYHVTTIPGLLAMWQSDRLGGDGLKARPSTTRSWNYALGYLKTVSNYGHGGGAIISIDQDLLKRDLGRRRIRGYDWFADQEPDDMNPDAERRSWAWDTDRAEQQILGGIDNLKRYIKRIDIWLPKLQTRRADAPPTDSYKYGEYQDPDANYDVATNLELITRWLKANPQDKAAWDQLKQDPRVIIHTAPGYQKQNLGRPLQGRQQYDQEHPAYRRPR